MSSSSITGLWPLIRLLHFFFYKAFQHKHYHLLYLIPRRTQTKPDRTLADHPRRRTAQDAPPMPAACLLPLPGHRNRRHRELQNRAVGLNWWCNGGPATTSRFETIVGLVSLFQLRWYIPPSMSLPETKITITLSL